MTRAAFVVLAAFALGAAPAVAQLSAPKLKKPAAKIAVTSCQQVSAVAAFFGEQKTRAYAESNLEVALDAAKSRRTAAGEIGLVVRNRKVVCRDYIDFGAAIGREQKCLASAELCLRAR
ncbi:MAG: hypothetical protein NW215_00185 [Hyphomicrobiales bacterium]|nr:hypothetical protein [Hyphomicrobiales bacterium]